MSTRFNNVRICLNGRALSGKDTVAEILQDYGFSQLSFAQPIYSIAREYFNMQDKNRPLLIAIGQGMREINENVWVNWVMKQVASGEYNNIVISDVRQANEYIRCIEEGFVPVRVSSSLENRIKRCELRDGFEPDSETIELWSSEGETGADDFPCYEIYNDRTIEDLYEQVDILLDKIQNGELSSSDFYKINN